VRPIFMATVFGLLIVGAGCDDSVGNNIGGVFRDCSDCPEMVILPSGDFRMGDIAGIGNSNERPVHSVIIPQSFAVGRYEVTVGQFRQFVGETGHEIDGGCNDWTGNAWEIDSDISWQNPGFTQSDQHAVGCINWEDAQAYVTWLSQKTGQDYRLLSDAEWEYAHRAGARTLWPHGNDGAGLCRYGNVRDATYRSRTGAANGAPCDDAHLTKAPVGGYLPNRLGLFDMTGNVYEWVQDCWNDSFVGAPADGSAWLDGDCDRHVLRGGSWPSRPWGLRSAFRNNFEAGNRSNNFGFRVARTLPLGVPD